MSSPRERFLRKFDGILDRTGTDTVLIHNSVRTSAKAFISNDEEPVTAGPHLTIQSNAPVFMYPSDLIETVALANGDTIEQGDTDYVVREVRHNGHGMCRVRCIEAT